MDLLSKSNKPGFFTYRASLERLEEKVMNNEYPTFEEFWEQEIQLIPEGPWNIHFRKNAKEETRSRLYYPCMCEALVKKIIREKSKLYRIIETTDDDDWIYKVDIKAEPIDGGIMVIIQSKSSVPKWAKLVNENSSQILGYGRKAEYIVVKFDELSLPDCTIIWLSDEGEKEYKPDEIDVMLSQMEDSQKRKIEEG